MLVRDAMLTRPRTHTRELTVTQARDVLANSHVHLLLLVEDGQLLGTLDRDELPDGPDGPDDDRPAYEWAGLLGRTVRADAGLDDVRAQMQAAGHRRLAVLEQDSDRLVGLLCLKASAQGFCSDAGVAARARERALDELSRG